MEDRKKHWYEFYFSNGVPPVEVALKNYIKEISEFLSHDDSVLWIDGNNETPSAVINIAYVAYVIEIK